MQLISIAMIAAVTAQAVDATRYGNAAVPTDLNSQLTLAEEPTTQPTLAVAPPQTAAATTIAADAPAQRLQADQAESQRSVLAQFAKPSDLMRRLMNAPAAGQLSGTPLTLREAVRDAANRQQQTERAKAYWDLAAAVGDYYLAELELTELEVLRQGITTPAQRWHERLEEARSRVELAQHAAQAAQLRLHQLLGSSDNGTLPLPADVPHCGRYNAEYEEIFAAQPHPVARQLSELMPLRYDELRAQAQAIAAAEASREAASGLRDPAGDGLELLQTQDLLALQRRSFIALARDYNNEIAQYTELAAPAEVAPERLVAMMIRTSTTGDNPTWESSAVQQAAAEQPLPPDAAALPPSVTPPTDPSKPAEAAAAKGYREVRRPLQRLMDREREHSIVKAIRRVRDRIE